MKLVYIFTVSCFIQILLALAVPVPIYAEYLEFDGLIEPHMVVKVGCGVSGVLATVDVDRGEMVQKGQVLATLQSDVEKATMELARTRAKMEASIKAKQERSAYSERQQKRIADLYKEKALSYEKMDEAETNWKLAELEVLEAIENKRLAEMELKRAIKVVKRMKIVSPVKGVVVKRFLSPGEFVEDQPILELAQIDTLNVEVILPVDMLGYVRVGMQAEVKPEALGSGNYSAEVTIVDRVVDAASGTFGVRLEMPNPKYRLPPGLKCKVIFHDE